jgi:hypothetical protein
MKNKSFNKRTKVIGATLMLIMFALALVGSLGLGAAFAVCFTIPLVSNMKAKGMKLDETQEKFFTELESAINSEMSKAIGAIVTEKTLTEKLEAFKTANPTLSAEKTKEIDDMIASVKAHAQELQKIKDSGIDTVEKVNPIAKALNDNKERIKTFLAAKNGLVKIEVKAVEQMDPATDIATHTLGDRVPGIGQIPVRKPFMEDLFPVVNCNSEFIRYIDQESVVRDAKNVATAGASSHTTKITWKERNIQITNVRDMIDVPVNMLDDYEFVAGEIKNLIGSSVALKVDNDLLTGDGTHPNLHSVDEVASEFSAANTLGGTIAAWTATVETPTIFDLVIAMTSQIIALGKDGSFIPNVVLFNTIDRYKSMLIKNKNGDYQLPPFVARVNGNEYNIDGMIVRSNPNVPANSLRVMDSTKGTIYNRKGVVIEMSYENGSNFETEVVTIKAYRRLNLLIRNVNKNAFMKCSDIDAALLALAKV